MKMVVRSSWLLLVGVVATLYAWREARAECCGIPLGGGACEDGTSFTAGCCGIGACNIFCCNCDGGCRQAHNLQECTTACEGKRAICYSGCTLSCSAVRDCGTCDKACDIDMRRCEEQCQKKFPTSINLKQEAAVPGGVQPSTNVQMLVLYRLIAIDKNQDGSISRGEFDTFVKGQEEKGAKCGGPAKFEQLDSNKDGRLTLDEVDKSGAAYLLENQGKVLDEAQKLKPYLTTVLKTLGAPKSQQPKQ